jgi:hypothetical protein
MTSTPLSRSQSTHVFGTVDRGHCRAGALAGPAPPRPGDGRPTADDLSDLEVEVEVTQVWFAFGSSGRLSLRPWLLRFGFRCCN